MLGNTEARDQAASQAKLYILDQQIAHPLSDQNLIDLRNQRAAIVAVAEAQNRQRDAQAALSLQSPAEEYANKKDDTDRAVAALTAMKAARGEVLSYGDQLQIAARRQDELDTAIDQTVSNLLKQGSAMNGVKAFFDDMQKQAITTGKIIYDALHQAFDGIADNFTKLITGEKTDFGKMLKDIGTQMVKSTITQQLQKGAAGLAKMLPGPLGAALGSALGGKMDGNTEATALWVQMAGGSLAGDSGGGGGFVDMLKSAFGGGDGGAEASDFDGLAGMASGGAVSPDSAYLVGEHGPEILSGASGAITSNTASSRMLNASSGATANYTIDARGTDPVLTEQRTRKAIMAAHSSAITTGMQLSAERLKRVPAHR
jgi:hypothetical protein